jgi:DNA invertase Pin-like site-specific DNA recombinase
MFSINGHGLKRVILYARVFSDDQVRGYSLDQQIGALREWAAGENHKVVEEVRDEGWSGAYLERPGLDRVRDLVEAGGVDVVVAQDADRITRDPGHRAFLDGEFERFGTRLVALDGWGDTTHKGELLKFLRAWVSKGEHLKIGERAVSLRDLSRITGLAFDMISHLGTGKQLAQPRTIRNLADALGVEPCELIKGANGG